MRQPAAVEKKTMFGYQADLLKEVQAAGAAPSLIVNGEGLDEVQAGSGLPDRIAAARVRRKASCPGTPVPIRRFRC